MRSPIGYSIDDLLSSPVTRAMQEPVPSAQNAYTEAVDPSVIGSGSSTGQVSQDAGAIFSGKTAFNNDVAGYRLGVDEATRIAKFFIGDQQNYLNWDGDELVIAGNITATTGSIGGFEIEADHIRDTGNTMGMSSVVSGDDDIRFWAGDTFENRETAPFSVSESGRVVASDIIITGGSVSASILDGVIEQGNLDVGNRGWSQTCAFVVDSESQVSWAAGTLTSADGTVFNISAGDTGTMVARTYVYLDVAVSTTEYQTSTDATDAVGVGKVLVAVAEDGSGEATFVLIQLSVITGDQIAANSIEAGKMLVSQLSAITADMGAITAGTIDIQTTGYVRSGQTGFGVGTGWWLGIDGGVPKFSIGNATEYITWDGDFMRIAGNLILNSVFTNIAYTVATLPIPPTTAGFNSPSANE